MNFVRISNRNLMKLLVGFREVMVELFQTLNKIVKAQACNHLDHILGGFSTTNPWPQSRCWPFHPQLIKTMEILRLLLLLLLLLYKKTMEIVARRSYFTFIIMDLYSSWFLMGVAYICIKWENNKQVSNILVTSSR
jgi:hypothetical protein